MIIVSASEMRELLKTEYGICSDKELNEALIKGGIKIGIFTEKAEKREEQVQEVC